MEAIRDNPLTIAAKRQAAQEKTQGPVPPGFNETTLGRAARVMAPSTIEFALIRSAARASKAAYDLTEKLIDLADIKPVPEVLVLNALDELSAALPGLLLDIDLTRNMALLAHGYTETAKSDRGGLQPFFSGYMAAANRLEHKARELERRRGRTPPPVDPDAPTYTKYEILELTARMAAEGKQGSDING